MESGEEKPPPVQPVARWDARLYDDNHAYVWEHAADLVELLAPRPGERILDVGCGTGHLTAKIAGQGAHTVGIDNAESMIAQARSNYPTLRFEVVDALSLTYAEEFDAVFSNAALHWIRPPEEVAARLWNALRPGGRFVAEFGGRGNVQSIIGAIIRASERMGLPVPGRQNPWYFPTLGEYCSLLERQGFSVAYATLFERPTPLEEGEKGLRNWLGMFGGSFLLGLPDEMRSAIMLQVEEQLRPQLYRGGAWVADYKRLCVVALKNP